MQTIFFSRAAGGEGTLPSLLATLESHRIL